MKAHEYTKFRESFNFSMPELKKVDDKIYFEDEVVEDSETKYWMGENFINIGFNAKESKSKVLSNLFSIEFKFKGKKVSSIEGELIIQELLTNRIFGGIRESFIGRESQ